MRTGTGVNMALEIVGNVRECPGSVCSSIIYT